MNLEVFFEEVAELLNMLQLTIIFLNVKMLLMYEYTLLFYHEISEFIGRFH